MIKSLAGELAVLTASLFVACSSSVSIPFEKEARKDNAAITAYKNGQSLEEEGKYREAISSYELSLNSDKTRDAALYKIGHLSSLIGDWQMADESFSTLLREDTENVTVRQSLAYVYCRAGRKKEGLELYRELHEEQPYDESVYQGYIKALKLNGMDEEAKKEEEAFASLFPHLMSK